MLTAHASANASLPRTSAGRARHATKAKVIKVNVDPRLFGVHDAYLELPAPPRHRRDPALGHRHAVA